MNVPATPPKPTWLSSYDPTKPSSLAGLLNPKGVKDPASSTTPAGFNVLAPASLKPAPAKPPSQYQLALSAFKVTADTFLIQSALNGYQPLSAPAAFGSNQAYYQGLNSSAQIILAAGKSGKYGNINAFA